MARSPDLGRAIEAAVARAVKAELGGSVRKLEREMKRLGQRLHGWKVSSPSAKSTLKAVSSVGRQLQGRYIGLIRNLPAGLRNRIRKIRASKGVQAAIRAAEKARQ